MARRTILFRLLLPIIRNKPLFLILFLGLLVRLVLIPTPGFEADIAYWKWWGEAASKGPANVLATTSINYPPFFIYVLGLIWKIYEIFQPFETASDVFKTNTFVFLFIVKFPAILSDLLSAVGIWWLVKQAIWQTANGKRQTGNGAMEQWNNEKQSSHATMQPFNHSTIPLAAAAIYLANPVVIFDSAFWGQTDSIAAVLVLGCLIFLIKNKIYVAAALSVIALETKVQTVIFLPFIYLLILRWHGLKKLWQSLSVAALTFLIINLPYILSGNMIRAMNLILDSSSYFPLASLNAYNIWWIAAGGNGFTTPDTILIAHALTWKSFGMMLFVASYTLTCLYLWRNSKYNSRGQTENRQPTSLILTTDNREQITGKARGTFDTFGTFDTLKPILLSFSLAAFAFYMLPTQIHERYIFPIFLFLSILIGYMSINSKYEARNPKQSQNPNDKNPKESLNNKHGFKHSDFENFLPRRLAPPRQGRRPWEEVRVLWGNLFRASNFGFRISLIYYIFLTLSIFANLHIVLVQNYPENGLPLLNFMNNEGFYLPFTLFLSWLNIVLFLILFIKIIKALPKLWLLSVFVIFFIFMLLPIITTAKLRSQKEVLLSSLKPSYNRQDWGSLAMNTSIDKHILSSAYVWYDKGLGSHANSQIDYYLNGEYQTFTTDFGVDVEAADNGSVEFIILGDGKTLYKSPLMRKWTFPQHARVNVRGIKKLSLIITDGGDGKNGDHADWLNPILYK